MQTVLGISLVAFYLSLMPVFFTKWMRLFRREPSLEPDQSRASWLVITIATVLWPVVIPFAYLQLLGGLRRRSI